MDRYDELDAHPETEVYVNGWVKTSEIKALLTKLYDDGMNYGYSSEEEDHDLYMNANVQVMLRAILSKEGDSK